MKEAEEEPKEWVDDGSLPLNKDGQLLFYFLDAHEDANLPHTVYLFGKVINTPLYVLAIKAFPMNWTEVSIQ